MRVVLLVCYLHCDKSYNVAGVPTLATVVTGVIFSDKWRHEYFAKCEWVFCETLCHCDWLAILSHSPISTECAVPMLKCGANVRMFERVKCTATVKDAC